ncbi:MAG: prephenate dehydrogenase [Actinomycetota bacterium]
MSVPVAGPVLVVGSGLLGTSVGLALRRAGVEVQLDDVDASVLAAAVARGAGVPRKESSPDPTLVVIAVPPGAAGQAMADACRFSNATVTDVTSVKALPMEQARSAGADPHRLVGGHPLAGRETSGPGAARLDLFDDRVWVICPGDEADPARVDAVVDLVVTCGAVPLRMSPLEHDRAVALTSHAPQVMASLLAARLLDADPEAVTVSGQALKDMTRVAQSDPLLWQAILRANSGSVADVLQSLADELSDVIADLRSGGAAGAMAGVLTRGVSGRQRVPGKHGSAADAYDVVAVVVADRPGQLASLFVAAGDLDVNLEDVRIDHVLGKPSGLIELSVRPDVSARLSDGLRQRGFDVRT